MATYSLRTLSADLPGRVRVQAVVSAARESLRNRGYTIDSALATEDRGEVCARPPGAGLAERTVVRSVITDTGVRASVTVEPFGDQAASRAILDGILARLGL